MKIKLDEYIVYSQKRKREYSIIVFDVDKNLWPLFDFDRDEPVVEGDKEAYKQLGFAYGILCDNPDHIMYFPVKNIKGIGDYYHNNVDMVISRMELQLSLAIWQEIKKNINRAHYCGKAVFSYNRQKLMDRYSQIERKDSFYSDYSKCKKMCSQNRYEHVMFMNLPRLYCYLRHNSIAAALREYKNGKEVYYCADVGTMITDKERWIMSMGDDFFRAYNMGRVKEVEPGKFEIISEDEYFEDY